MTYNYGSPGSLDDTVSRLTEISDSGGTIEQYLYMGLGTVVQRTHPKSGAPGVNIGLTYLQQTGDPACNPGQPGCDAGDKYIGLDRFGRIIDQHWQQIGAPQNDTDRFQYGYDRDSNRLYRNNLINNTFGELYHASGAGNGYDVLNQMTDFARGTLSSSNPPNGPLDTIATPSITKNWNLDIVGNWNSVCTNPTGTNCSGGTLQSRTHNKQNEVTQVGSAAPQFDNNGNTITDDNGNQLTFDAWNRLATVTVTGIGTISYKYDALNRRGQRSNGGLRDFYFSQAWQNLEERDGTNITQYIWSPVYVDALIERDINGQCLHVQQDANFNVTSLTNNAGNVVERYTYDPYGRVDFRNPDFTLEAGGSQFAWVYLHQGGRLDPTTGFYNFRNREYSPTLGRWLQVDPMGYAAGDINLYRYIFDSPNNLSDPLGLSGGNTPAAQKGKDAHKPFPDHVAGRGEVTLPSGKRIDAVKETDKLINIHELKPDGSLLKEGEVAGSKFSQALRQAEGYAKEYANPQKKKMVVHIWGWVCKGTEKGFKYVKRFAKIVAPPAAAAIVILEFGNNVEAKGLDGAVADSLLDSLPVLGSVKGLYEIFSGEDLVPRNPLGKLKVLEPFQVPPDPRLPPHMMPLPPSWGSPPPRKGLLWR